LAILFIWIKDIFREIDRNNFNKINVQAGLNFLEVVENLLGIIPPQINIPEKIQKLVDKRLYAKENKNWVEADSIRQELIELGWKVEDTNDGTVCKPI
jgi:cysteinyl-tRNA synthetase